MITKQEAEALGLVALTEWENPGSSFRYRCREDGVPKSFRGTQYGDITVGEWMDLEVLRIEGYSGDVPWQQNRKAVVVKHPDTPEFRALFVNPVAGPGAPDHAKSRG